MIIIKKQNFKSFIKLSFLLFCLLSCNSNYNDINHLNIDQYLEKQNYNSLNRQSKEKCLDAIAESLNAIKNDSIVRNKYFKIADFYFDLHAIEKYKKTVKTVLKLSGIKKDTAHIAKAQRFLGDYYDNTSKTDSAFYFYNQAGKNFSILKDGINVARTKLYKAGILYDVGVYTESEIETIAALRLLEKSEKTRLKYECHNLLAINLIRLKNYDAALTYFKKADQILDILEKENYNKEKLLKSRIHIYNNIGAVYESLKDYKTAKECYLKALAMEDVEQNNPKLYAMLINNIAYTDLLLGNTRNVRQNLYKALEIKKKLNFDAGVVSSKLTIAKYFLHQKDTAMAIQMLNETYREATAIKSNSDILESLRILIDVDKSNTSSLAKLYLNTNDSIQNLERATRNKFARIEFETDGITVEKEKFEAVNKLLSNTLLVVVAFVILAALLVLLIFKNRNQKAKSEALFLKQEQQIANATVYQLMLEQQDKLQVAKNNEKERISRDLHDGVMGKLTAVRLNLYGASHREAAEKNEVIATQIKEIKAVEVEIRNIAHDLQQHVFNQKANFIALVNNLVANTESHSNTVFTITVDDGLQIEQTGYNVQINLYRIIQEALQNIKKYANAKNVAIVFSKNSVPHIMLTITDDGVGFDVASKKSGIGIKNMKSRVDSLNGTFTITSNAIKGTKIQLSIPI